MPYLDVDSTGKVRVFGGEFDKDQPWDHVHEYTVLPDAPYVIVFAILVLAITLIYLHLLRVDFANGVVLLPNSTIANVRIYRPWMSNRIYISGDFVATITLDSLFSSRANVICGNYRSRGQIDADGSFSCPFFRIVDLKKTKVL